jgi:hypothetical protein
MSCVALGQQPRRVRRSGGLDNLSLPSTDVSLASASWQQVAPEGAGFSVMMPGLPEEMSKDMGPNAVGMRQFHLKAGDTDYAVGVVLNLPAELTEQPGFASQYFQLLPTGMIKAAEYASKNYKLVSQRAISIKDYPGRQFKFDAPDYTCSMRAYMIERNVYILIVESPKASVSNDNVEKFLSSFVLKQD